ncbi:hypothetical protein KKB18_00320 [bacterium]|nr:hypothetical protein [bacterium]
MPSVIIIPILAVVNIPLYILAGKLIFGDWDSFKEALWFWIKPNLWSLFDGTIFEDWIAELKLGLLFFICAGIVFGEYWVIWKIMELFE